ncbi:hypothetical protein PIB30_038631, partial [Stylosanthes scabra]|nr:hypothetical protein [Stylosanthes scabra]
WSAIATHLPKRTDNEIKNYWNTHLKKRLTKMGIDPVTHKPKNDALFPGGDGGGHSNKAAANLSHMAQWESARLEAEARLVRESKLRSQHQQHFPSSSSSSSSAQVMIRLVNESTMTTTKDWNNNHGDWFLRSNNESNGGGGGMGNGEELESPTSTLSFSENNNASDPAIIGENSNNNGVVVPMIANSGSYSENHEIIRSINVKEEGSEDHHDNCSSMGPFNNNPSLHELAMMTMESTWGSSSHNNHDDESLRTSGSNGAHVNDDDGNAQEEEEEEKEEELGFTNLLLNTSNNNDEVSLSSEGGDGGESHNNNNNNENGDSYEDKNYWNSILHLVNSSPSHSPIF